jgi:hypothetical protein
MQRVQNGTQPPAARPSRCAFLVGKFPRGEHFEATKRLLIPIFGGVRRTLGLVKFACQNQTLMKTNLSRATFVARVRGGGERVAR